MLKEYAKPAYIGGGVAGAWLLSVGLIFALADNLAGSFDLAQRSIIVTAALLFFVLLVFLVFLLGRIVGALPALGVLRLSNWLHRRKSRYAHLLAERPIELSRLTFKGILFSREPPFDKEKS